MDRHVREWTMTEFNILSSFYGINQIECQYNLLEIK